MASRVNNTNGESNEENQTPANRRGASQQQPSQPPQPNSRRALGEPSTLPSVADLQTLESSFGSLSVSGSSLPQQNQFLDNRWTNGSSSSSSRQSQEINGGAGGGHRSLRSPHDLSWQEASSNDNAYAWPLFYRNGDGTFSRVRNWGSDNNGFGSVMSNSSWRSNQGYVYNNRDHRSHSSGNPRMRSIADLAKDQGSSAELQRRISQGSKETVDLIFDGVINHVCDLMVDLYGQHVIRMLMERCSYEQITRIVDVITQEQIRFDQICNDPVGALSVNSLLRCLQSEQHVLRVVQAVILGLLAFTTSKKNNAALAYKRSSNAALVILQCFKQFDSSYTRDLLDVIAQNCFLIATDEYGCRMLQLCLLDIDCDVVKQRLIHGIIANALRLCVDSYGNYVVQYLVELGDPNVTICLITQLLGSYSYLARNKFASHVVQKFLQIEYINPSSIMRELLRDIDTLLLDPFGNYVIQTAWFVCSDELRMILWAHIDRNKPLMRCNMYGNKILRKLNL